MKNKTMNLQLRLSNLQYEFLRKRAAKLNLNISKMISIFIADQRIAYADQEEFYELSHSFVPLYNNIHQLIRASRFVSFRVEDRSIHERFIQIAETLEDDLERNASIKLKIVNLLNDVISNDVIKSSNDFMKAHDKNISLNVKLLGLDESDSFSRRLMIRMTDEERRNVEISSKVLGTSMKNTVLALAMSANVFSVSSFVCNDKSELREHGQLLNGIARFMNESLKSDKKIEDTDMLSMISDLNVIDDFVRNDTEFYEDVMDHLHLKIKVKIINEGVYWTSSFRKKVKENTYGRE